MRIPSLVFIVLLLLIVSKYIEIVDVDILVIVGIFVLWIITLYISIHLDNKKNNTSRPVHITN